MPHPSQVLTDTPRLEFEPDCLSIPQVRKMKPERAKLYPEAKIQLR